MNHFPKVKKKGQFKLRYRRISRKIEKLPQILKVAQIREVAKKLPSNSWKAPNEVALV